MSHDDDKAGMFAGGAVIAAVALGGIAMAVIRRVAGRQPEHITADNVSQPADEAVEDGE